MHTAASPTPLDAKTIWESDAFPAPFSGPDGARQFFKVYLTAFPDLHLDVQQILAAGDNHMVVRWRSRGTHLGPLLRQRAPAP
ncbi:MAG: hypothetical protein DME00_21950 [Candidatus Rokuibacteriota bacterium]|nr:MAG: hypothetical protein DME00_21950 [Candidatus Rokubacteria bacterium]PYO05555.1 MAG: hypothetical protein DMD75_27645 [Candidatus Rokubacteria bacterium]